MKFNCLIVVLMMTASLLFAEGEVFEPTSKDNLEKFYSVPERSVTVSVDESVKLHSVSSDFLGVNLSYFNDTDTIWKEHDILDKLKKSGVKALRYPGGEETSFFHWQSPGVNGYEDLWAPEKQHGTSPGRGRFQVTWVAPSKWETNKEFMNFDEFMFACKELKASPIVGLNLSSGKKYNRRKEGVQEALRWLRYCRDKNYEVKYWFLDNEPWHFEAAHTFSLDEYAEEVLVYGKAIKKEFPNVKLIANPMSSTTYNYREGLQNFINKTGDVIDYIDVHWYWKWGNSNWWAWKSKTPMENETQWYDGGSYVVETAYFNNLTSSLGHPTIKLASLEWNIAPGDHNTNSAHTSFMTALMQSEMQMQMMQAGIEYASMWTTQWENSSNAEFLQLVNSDDNYKPSPTAEFFKLYKNALNGVILESNTIIDNLLVTSVLKDDNKVIVYLLNKNNEPTPLDFNIDGYSIQSVVKALCFQDPGLTKNIEIRKENTIYVIEVPEYSLTMIEFLVE